MYNGHLFDQTYSREDVTRIQRALNELTFGLPNTKPIKADGLFGNQSIALLNALQRDRGFEVTTSFVGRSKETVMELVNTKYVTEKDICDQADALGFKRALYFAIREVEAKSAGFFDDGRCVILYERHKFFEYYSAKHGRGVALKLEAEHPTLCNRKSGGYLLGAREYTRLDAASKIDPEIAILSTSWGFGQVMGFNWQLAGAKDPFDLRTRSEINEYEQLGFMSGFLRKCAGGALLNACKRLDFASIAKYYNGSNYRINKYDERIANAYDKYKAIYPQ